MAKKRPGVVAIDEEPSYWTETVSLGDLKSSRVSYAPWLYSIRTILQEEHGLDWLRMLLIEDVDVDFAKGVVTLKMAPLDYEKGGSIFNIEITLKSNE